MFVVKQLTEAFLYIMTLPNLESQVRDWNRTPEYASATNTQNLLKSSKQALNRIPHLGIPGPPMVVSGHSHVVADHSTTGSQRDTTGV
jgi:hypothetical protein